MESVSGYSNFTINTDNDVNRYYWITIDGGNTQPLFFITKKAVLRRHWSNYSDPHSQIRQTVRIMRG